MTKLDAQIVEQLLVEHGVKVYSVKENKFLGVVYKRRHLYYFGGLKQYAKTKEELLGYTPSMITVLCDKLIDIISEKYWLQFSDNISHKPKVVVTLVDYKTNTILFSEQTDDLIYTLYTLLNLYINGKG